MTRCKEYQWNIQELETLQKAWNNPEEHQFEPDFVDNIMASLPVIDHTGDKSTIKSINKSTAIVHYMLATVATFALLFSGVFDQMPSFVNQYSNQMMEATFQLNQASDKGIDAINEIDGKFTNIFNLKIQR